MWWLAARVLAADDPAREAWLSAQVLEEDATPSVLADQLPSDATVTILGWPELVAAGLGARGDVAALVVDSWGGSGLAARLESAGLSAVEVPESGVGAAVVGSDLVLLEANALGPDAFVAASGSRAESLSAILCPGRSPRSARPPSGRAVRRSARNSCWPGRRSPRA